VLAIEEVSVAKARKGIAIAFFMTALDVAVISYSGPAIWQAWGNIPWMRMVTLLLAGVGSFTLVDIWARTFDFRCIRARKKAFGEAQQIAPATAALMEGADV
jgi:hypothetical protein